MSNPFDALVPDDPLFERPRLKSLLGKPKPVRESKIEAYLVKRVKALGGEVRKVSWIGRTGAPDRLVMLPRAFRGSAHDGQRVIDPQTIWVELKRPKKGAEIHQAREHEHMRRMGQRVVVINTIAAVDELFS